LKFAWQHADDLALQPVDQHAPAKALMAKHQNHGARDSR
jgi:hypothetical protein